jgi:hypothetical protein
MTTTSSPASDPEEIPPAMLKLWDLSGFKFQESTVDEPLARTLHDCAFIEDSHNVVFIGGPDWLAAPLRNLTAAQTGMCPIQPPVVACLELPYRRFSGRMNPLA